MHIRLIRGGLAFACFVLYLKVFKNHLYYLWHVRVLSIKPCLHTQLPEHNKSYRKVSRGWGHLITWNGPMMGHLNSFSASGEGNFPKIFQKFKCPGGCPEGGKMLKLRFDRYINSTDSRDLTGAYCHLNAAGQTISERFTVIRCWGIRWGFFPGCFTPVYQTLEHHMDVRRAGVRYLEQHRDLSIEIALTQAP